MSQDEINKMFGGFEKMAKQMQDAVVDSFSGMTKQAVGSDGFSAASSAAMDWSLASQKQVRSNSAQFLDSLEFPKRSDIARVSKQISSAESRIADCEDVLDKVLGALKRVESKLDALATRPAASPSQAPVQQVEAEAPVKPAEKAILPEVSASEPSKHEAKPTAAAKKAARPANAARNAGRAAKKSK